MDTNQKTSLGCGTLILIALIVLILGNLGSEDMGVKINDIDSEIKTLQEAVGRIESKIDQQARDLQELASSLQEVQGAPNP